MNRFRMGLMCAVFFFAGYLANTLLTPKQVQAQVQGDRVYKAVPINGKPGSPQFIDSLNSAAKGGWRFVPMDFGGGAVVFEKEFSNKVGRLTFGIPVVATGSPRAAARRWAKR